MQLPAVELPEPDAPAVVLPPDPAFVEPSA
jgi:hypothetical protein